MLTAKRQFKKLHDLLLTVKPRPAEVIIWLQGDRFDRAAKVLELYQAGWSKRILISGNNILIGGQAKLGEDNISLDQMKIFLGKKGIKGKSLLVDNGAMNTKEQAEHIFKIAKAKKWSKVILVSSSYYQPRAFLTFLKQAKKIGWGGEIISQAVLIGWDEKPGGRAESARIIFRQEFEKISRYKKDLAPVAEGLKYLSQQSFKLRKVTKQDRRLLFTWANDAAVRANATSSQPITWPGHITWFANRLADPETVMYILMKAQSAIGVVRFEKKGSGFLISYSIDQRYRGQGWGKVILQAGMEELKKVCHRPKFIAYVKRGNIPSEKIFNSLNFVLKKQATINKLKFNIYQK